MLIHKCLHSEYGNFTLLNIEPQIAIKPTKISNLVLKVLSRFAAGYSQVSAAWMPIISHSYIISKCLTCILTWCLQILQPQVWWGSANNLLPRLPGWMKSVDGWQTERALRKFPRVSFYTLSKSNARVTPVIHIYSMVNQKPLTNMPSQ